LVVGAPTGFTVMPSLLMALDSCGSAKAAGDGGQPTPTAHRVLSSS
jgi:hypothetical protein